MGLVHLNSFIPIYGIACVQFLAILEEKVKLRWRGVKKKKKEKGEKKAWYCCVGGFD